LLLISCNSNNNSTEYKDETYSESNTSNNVENKDEQIKIMQSSNAVNSEMIGIMLNMATQNLQMTEQNIQSQQQTNQMMPEMQNSSQTIINELEKNKQYQQRVIYEWSYYWSLTKMQSTYLSTANTNMNYFQSAQALHASILYYLFGSAKNKKLFPEVASAAIQWFTSPQANIDIQNVVKQLQAQSSINAKSINSTYRQENNFLSENFSNEKLSDIILDRTDWRNPNTGEQMKLNITIDQAWQDGVELQKTYN